MEVRDIVRWLECAPWRIPSIARYLRHRMAQERRVSCFPHVPALLLRLQADGRRMVLVTSNSEDNVRLVLGERISQLFDGMLCDVGLTGKRAALSRVLRRARVLAQDAVSVGDEIRDARAARALGVPFIGVAWGYSDADVLRPLCSHGLAHEIATLGEMLGLGSGWLSALGHCGLV